ncbi:hypothetical protein SAMN05216489_01507 [Streptomyces sp. 3213]|nr:hypothetical protein SAMN05216489_01507 [Streptomyces sp. 3213] [Streptomyces sp. 3213.3]
MGRLAQLSSSTSQEEYELGLSGNVEKLGLKGYKLGRGRNSKILYMRAEVFKWLEQQRLC